MGRRCEIEYLHHPSKRVVQLLAEFEKRRKTTFPFKIIVDFYLEVHNDVNVSFRDIEHGIIYMTFNPGDMDDKEYDTILNWLISKL